MLSQSSEISFLGIIGPMSVLNEIVASRISEQVCGAHRLCIRSQLSAEAVRRGWLSPAAINSVVGSELNRFKVGSLGARLLVAADFPEKFNELTVLRAKIGGNEEETNGSNLMIAYVGWRTWYNKDFYRLNPIQNLLRLKYTENFCSVGCRNKRLDDIAGEIVRRFGL